MSSDETAQSTPPPSNPRTANTTITSVWKSVAAVALVVAVMILVITYRNGFVWFPGYTASQWAAAGGWVGGLGAFAAVATALWQSDKARQDAAALLERELGAQRRADQLRSLDGIWAAVDGLRRPYDEFWEAHVDAEKHLPNPDDLSEESRRIANTLGVDLREAVIRANVAFEPALLQVIEPHTQKMLTAFYQDFLDVMETMMNLIANARKGTEPGYDALDHLDARLRKLQQHRGPFLNVTRKHLTNADVIKNIPNTDAHGNPYAGKGIIVLVEEVEPKPEPDPRSTLKTPSSSDVATRGD